MNHSDLIKSFVRQYRKPFGAETAAGMTAVDVELVKPVLSELVQSGMIKELETGIYVKANRYNPNLCYGQKGTWNFHPDAAALLLNYIAKGSYTSLRGIAAGFPRSRQWVFVYMEALASIDAIGYDGRYYVKSKARLKEIGKHIKKGILNEMTKKPTDPNRKTKEQLRAEAAERRRQRLERDAAQAKARQEMRAYKAAKKAEWEKIQAMRKKADEMIKAMIASYQERYKN